MLSMACPGRATWLRPKVVFKERCMRNLMTITLIVLAALLLGNFGPAPVQAQNNGQGGAPSEDMPHYTARKFAPFIRAIVLHRVNTAQGIFKMRRSVESNLEQPDTIRTLAHFQKPDSLPLNLIGGRTLGQNIGILLFTVATQDGPVSFKIYYYGFAQDINVARIEISDDWDTIESASSNIDLMSAPITVPLSSQIDENGGG
jgi:hypothetical protein